MAKEHGGTRLVLPGGSNSGDASAEFYTNLATEPGIVAEHSYLSPSGGQLYYYEGHNFHQDEIDAGRLMADDGFVIRLLPENDIQYATAFKKDGSPKYSDGKLEVYTYEQATKKPQGASDEALAKAVKHALEHCRSKEAEIAVIYDKYASFHQSHIKAGMDLFEKLHGYRFKAVLTVNTVHKKHVNEWHHDT